MSRFCDYRSSGRLTRWRLGHDVHARQRAGDVPSAFLDRGVMRPQAAYDVDLLSAPGVGKYAQRKFCASSTGWEPAKPPFVPLE